jgi:polysaccharide biosynthesis/export protein
LRSLLLTLIAATAFAGGCARTTQLSGAADLGLQGNARAPVLPGDRVALRIWTEPEMSDTFAVDESGRLALPTLGIVPAAGRPAGALQDSLRTAYVGYVRDPSVRVSVLRRVSVLGEVVRPGVYLADLTMVMSDAIAMAGGLTEGADPGKIILQREGTQIRVSQRDGSEYNLAGLRSGDQIVVRPKSFWARNPAVVVSTIGSAVSLLTLLVSYVAKL